MTRARTIQRSASRAPRRLADTTSAVPALFIGTVLGASGQQGVIRLASGSTVKASAQAPFDAASLAWARRTGAPVLLERHADGGVAIIALLQTAPPIAPSVVGGRLDLGAQEQVTISCGKSSITLTAAGKVIIDGTYVLARSRGVMQIQGTAVHMD